MLRIFLSSTYADLRGYRKAIDELLRRYGEVFVGMEYFGARSGTPLETCLEEVAACDLVLVLVGSRYGTLTGDGDSYTHREVRAAHAAGVPVLPFVQADPPRVRAAERRRRAEFVGFLGEHHTLARFTTPESLVTEVAAALRRFEDERRGGAAPHDVELPLRSYLERLSEMPAEAAPVPYLGGRHAADLYVEPDLHAPPEREEESEEAGDADALAGEPSLYGEPGSERERRVPMAELRERLAFGQPVIVTGAPGGGKSLVTSVEAAMHARDSLRRLTTGGAGVPDVELPVTLELPRLVGTSEPAAAVAEAVRAADPVSLRLRARVAQYLVEDGVDLAAAAYLATHLHEPRCALYLDALDEVEEGGGELALDALLEPLRGWQCRVMLTSRPSASLPPPWLPAPDGERPHHFRLAGLSRTQIDHYVNTRFRPDSDQSRLATLRFGGDSPLAAIAESPFLLTMMCWLVELGELDETITRTQLYARVLDNMLALKDDGSMDVTPGGHQRRVAAARTTMLRRLLSEAALHLALEGKLTNPIPGVQLLDLFAASRQRPAVAGVAAEDRVAHSQALLDELARKHVLLRLRRASDGTTGGRGEAWAFPHLTFAEFLAGTEAAEALVGARHTGDALWRTEGDVWEVLERKLIGDWPQATLLDFTAGSLANAALEPTGTGAAALRRYIAALTADPAGDPLHLRLAQAVRCVLELPLELHPPLWDDVVAVRRRAFGVWCDRYRWLLHSSLPVILNPPIELLQMCPPDNEEVVALLAELDERHSQRAIGLVRESTLAGVSEPALQWLLGWMESDDDRMSKMAARALGERADGPNHEHVLEELLARFDHPGAHVREAADAALEKLAPATIGPAARAALLEGLEAGNDARRRRAILTLEKLGPPAMSDAVMDRLEQLAEDPNPYVQRDTLRALKKLGTVAAYRDRVARLLLGALEEDDTWKERHAMIALAELDLDQVPLDAYVRGLEGEHPTARAKAIEALARRLDDLEPEAVLAVVDRLGDASAHVRRTAARALEKLAPLPPGDEMAARLARFAEHHDSDVRRAVARVLAPRRERTQHGDPLPVYLAGLTSSDATVRARSAAALGGLGERAASAAGVASLLERIDDGDEEEDVRAAALVALRDLAEWAGTEEVFIEVYAQLESDRWAIHSAAHDAVEAFRRVLGRPPALDRIVGRLTDPDAAARRQAAWLLWVLEPELGGPRLETLLACLEDRDKHVRCHAALALGACAPPLDDRVGAALLERIADADSDLRTTVTIALGDLRSGGAGRLAERALVDRLRDPDERVRACAAEALGAPRPPHAGEAVAGELRTALGDGSADVRYWAAWALGALAAHRADPETLTALAGAVRDEDVDVRRAAAEALAGLKPNTVPAAAVRSLCERLADPESRPEAALARAVGALARAGDPVEVTDAVLAALGRREHELAANEAEGALVWALGQAAALAPSERAVLQLMRVLEGRDWSSSSSGPAVDALNRLLTGPTRQDVVAILLTLLDGYEWEVRRWAARLLGTVVNGGAVTGFTLSTMYMDW